MSLCGGWGSWGVLKKLRFFFYKNIKKNQNQKTQKASYDASGLINS